jgi:peptide deformylase
MKVLTFPDPVLRQKAEIVNVFDDELKTLVADMLETMYDAHHQRHLLSQLFVAKLDQEMLKLSLLASQILLTTMRRKLTK